MEDEFEKISSKLEQKEAEGNDNDKHLFPMVSNITSCSCTILYLLFGESVVSPCHKAGKVMWEAY